MDFNLSKEELLVQQMYRSFAENEVKPLAQEVDEEERFPAETVKKMAKLGMMGIYFPKEYGGQGASYLSYVMAVEEMSKVCGTPVSSSPLTPACAPTPSMTSAPRLRSRSICPSCAPASGWAPSA